MNRKIRAMVAATKIYLRRGEELEAVLARWPALTDAEKDEIRKSVSVFDG